MSTHARSTRPSARARWLLVVGAVIVIGIAVILFTRGGAADPGTTATPGAPTSQDSEAADPSEPSDPTEGPTPTEGAPPDEDEDAEDTTGAPSDAPTVALDDDGERAQQEPVSMDEEASAAPDLVVRLLAVESVTGQATIQGEVERPAARVTVEVENLGDSEVDTRASVVNAYYGPDATPAGTYLQPGGRDLPSVVAAESSVDGVYIFDIPEDERDNVRIEVDFAPHLLMVVFEGALTDTD